MVGNRNLDSIGSRRLHELYANSNEERDVPVRYERLKARAKENMENGRYQYLAGGVGHEETMTANREAFDDWQIVPRVLRDVSNRSMAVSLFGRKLASPVLVAPVASQQIMHEDGDLASARAAASLGVPYVASSGSSTKLEDIAQTLGDTPRLLQLKLMPDRNVLESMVERAESAGYDGIVVTVDAPIPGWRVRLLESGYRPTQEGATVANYFGDPAFRASLEKSPESDPEAAMEAYRDLVWDASMNWDDLATLRTITDLPLFVKGIVHPTDAEAAVASGADGIVVSNHGGRQLDGAVGSLDALPDVVDAVGEQATVLFDSGIRQGSDVFKAIALGADAVLVGRPYLYGLAIDGENGVQEVLQNLLADLHMTMGLAGYNAITDVDRSAVVRR